jgi:ABC-type dipeptide/oligopeptide/nickel transport system permease subunit
VSSTAAVLEQQALTEERSWPGSVTHALVRFAKRKPVGAISGVVLALILLLAGGMYVAGDRIAPYGELESDRGGLAGPRAGHIFGTDRQGRDIFSRVLYGAKISITVGIVTVAASAVVATLIGLFSGYFGGVVDNLLMRANDILMAFPSLILALAIMAVRGASLNNVLLVITITQVPYIARVARSAVISVKENQYVEAAKALGARDMRIVFRHVFPNIIPVLIVYSGTYIGYAIVTEASLSFLGVGIPPTQASWGGMLSQDQARSWMRVAPYIVLFPSLALTLTVLSANLFADALRDHLDPRLRGSR